ncbi:MAG: ATP-dependent sacrificial sulfur transferase LarE [Nitrososphaerota archaeon]|uniref:ATP-dependent sacrificial sulfur transferase LarE n=1 Tax=Candidatus Bathycorpusculum sp. TaxID=2994959 RepID=UPI002826C7B0|nr:ATP-dependent sacrificial sulfur transferase LarE [Candidatus Termiticorpusculum sp.]MCL2257563.1 ATP-dependent sacrificial sulfur transferase LarE [Candidatus Termiticorpusculum sp.]MCL2292302.1 ATP-dependent sacrificial sulfur transferase LarE [Candidatus Termiticorpusculum sp.]MDR0461228.1 ATP-dependent sacrificial sulfur transferase LarE [Nitrososphaerota archaeon]
MMETTNQKLELFKRYITDMGKNGVAIAFSGGVDSSTLAAISHMFLGEKAVAIIAQSPIHSSEELQHAKKIAADIGIKLYITQTNELSNPNFTSNPENRCYYCKQELLTSIKHLAYSLNLRVVFEGTNYSDLNSHRPGFKAVQETLNVISPWVVNKFSKDEIRQLAKQLNLSFYDKPALACLASRVVFNQKITIDVLDRIEHAESAVKTISGAKQVRVRDHDGLARIEISKTEFSLLCNIAVWNKISEALLKLGFTYVTLDLHGYQSGSMLKTLKE